MPFDPSNTGLPIVEIIPAVKEQLQNHNTLIVNAAPGAGKSTLLPLTILGENWLQGKKILMLEPRRLAAKTIAARMASLWGDEIGDTIGYRIRFENRVTASTKIEVVTEGILTRMLHHDNALENVGMVIFDEFHERSIHADLALALCRESQQVLRPDLRILIMSATLDMPQLTALLQAPVIQSEGRQFPVDIKYASALTDEMFMVESAASTVRQAVNEHEGDTLVFLPGEGEIRKCAEILESQLPSFSIHPLYGQLTQQEQFRAIMPDKFGKRKVVLATSIAETSLTIEGVKIVVDTGFGRTQRFDAKSGLSKLETIRIAKDSAAQRAGRAGRLSPGVCYRLWTKATQDQLQEHRVPEILEADLCSLMLDMAVWGISDINKLTWLTPPPKFATEQAQETLVNVEAIDEDGRVTTHGKEIHRLACHPRIAHMLVLAQKERLADIATDIAAILEERDPLNKEAGIDINLRIDALRRARTVGRMGHRLTRIEKSAQSYRRMLNIDVNNQAVDPYNTGLLLAYAYPERIAYARPGSNARFQLANGKLAVADHKDDIAHEPWLAVAHLDARDGGGKIFMASPLNPKDLKDMVKEKEILTWDTRKGGLVATKDLRIGNIVLQSKPLPMPSKEDLVKVVSKAIESEGETLLNIDEAFEQLQNRILSLRKWNPDDNWPDVSTPVLLKNNLQWLGPYLENVKRVEDLQKLNITEALLHHLDWNKQQELDKLAPKKIEVPSGSSIRIQYFSDGTIPVLSVRLQEVFGMAETPRVNNGKMGMILHLLSPGFKPVQVTSDLKSFWDNTYFEVRKELKRRYPKHSWPDDPWTAEAVAKGRPRQ